jgi:glucose-1-phosphate cytidylyltransferase
VLERQPLQDLARDGQLQAYRHDGFWECMDTYKDAVALNDLWTSGESPWHRPPAKKASRCPCTTGIRTSGQPAISRARTG